MSLESTCHYLIPLLETSLRMVILRPKHVEAHCKVTNDCLALIVDLLD
jgi:hypothetical protein